MVNIIKMRDALRGGGRRLGRGRRGHRERRHGFRRRRKSSFVHFDSIGEARVLRIFCGKILHLLGLLSLAADKKVRGFGEDKCGNTTEVDGFFGEDDSLTKATFFFLPFGSGLLGHGKCCLKDYFLWA